MTECKHIHEMLPALLEGVLSPDGKRLVLEHLATCRHCSMALEDLKKVAQLIRGLEEVEPPPWFKQKVMSQVREESERKKGLFGRLFYPLHVKVPIQALASVLIVVLALYVYRSVEPEIKVVQAPSEVAPRNPAVPKNEGQQQYDKVGAGTSRAENEPVLGQRRKEAAGAITEVPHTEAAKNPAKEEVTPPARLIIESAKPEKAETVAGGQAQEMRAAAPSPVQEEPHQAPKALPPVLARREGENKASAGVVAKMKEARDSSVSQAEGQTQALAAKKAEPAGFALRVNNATAAAGEIKGLLGQLGARNIAAESRDGTTVITAELASQKIEELFKKLSALGQVEKRGPRPASTDGLISIRIELTGKPYTN